MKVLICIRHHLFEQWCAPDWFGPRLQAAFPDLDVLQLPSYDRLSAEIPDADVFVGWSLRPEQFRAAASLRWIHATAAGVGQLLHPDVVASSVLLTNSRNVQGPVVAEHVIALIFALAKRLADALRHQARHEWAQNAMWDTFPRPREVAGATLGLVGFGSIGRETARRALALGMRVLAVREHPQFGAAAGRDLAPPAFTTGADLDALNLTQDNSALRQFGNSAIQVLGFDQLDTVLAQSDFLVLAAPLTPRTERLLDASRLARLRPTAYLINVSRGALIDEPALVAALRDRRLAGAALDVFATEPLPPDSPLLDLPTALVTPHIAALVDGLWERHYDLLVLNLRRFLAGLSLLNLVDKHKGY